MGLSTAAAAARAVDEDHRARLIELRQLLAVDDDAAEGQEGASGTAAL
jgi:ADP-ribose pyrophosphatase YjhB (NUDIX family)